MKPLNPYIATGVVGRLTMLCRCCNYVKNLIFYLSVQNLLFQLGAYLVIEGENKNLHLGEFDIQEKVYIFHYWLDSRFSIVLKWIYFRLKANVWSIYFKSVHLLYKKLKSVWKCFKILWIVVFTQFLEAYYQQIYLSYFIVYCKVSISGNEKKQYLITLSVYRLATLAVWLLYHFIIYITILLWKTT